MPAKSIVYVCVVLLFVSTIIDAYRLDGLSHLDDSNHANELDDPYLIERLQALLAAAGTVSKRALEVKDLPMADQILMHRLAINRRPGLLRLKKKS